MNARQGDIQVMTPEDRVNAFLGRSQSYQYDRADSSDAISAMLHDLANAYDTNQHPATRARYLEYLAGEAWHQAELAIHTDADSQEFEQSITSKVKQEADNVEHETEEGVLREALTRDYLAAAHLSIVDLIDAIDYRDFHGIEVEQRIFKGNIRNIILSAAKAAWLIDPNDTGN